MFKVLSGTVLHELDQKSIAIASADQTSSRDFGIVAYMPQKYESVAKKQQIDDRVLDATGGVIGNVGDKVTRTVEVLRCFQYLHAKPLAC